MCRFNFTAGQSRQITMGGNFWQEFSAIEPLESRRTTVRFLAEHLRRVGPCLHQSQTPRC